MKLCHALGKVMTAIDSRTPLWRKFQKQSCRKGACVTFVEALPLTTTMVTILWGQVTNDIFTKEDGEFLVKNEALTPKRIWALQTGGYPHAAIREDIKINLGPLEELSQILDANILLCKSGGGISSHYNGTWITLTSSLVWVENCLSLIQQSFCDSCDITYQ
jgi:hypothetical protein